MLLCKYLKCYYLSMLNTNRRNDQEQSHPKKPHHPSTKHSSYIHTHAFQKYILSHKLTTQSRDNCRPLNRPYNTAIIRIKSGQDRHEKGDERGAALERPVSQTCNTGELKPVSPGQNLALTLSSP